MFAELFSRRLKARTVNVDSVVASAVREAIYISGFGVTARHGGSVPSRYKYPAETEACCAVAHFDPKTGTVSVIVRFTEISAKAATDSGVARSTFPILAPLFDSRYGEQSKDAAWAMLEDQWSAILASEEGKRRTWTLPQAYFPYITEWISTKDTTALRVLSDLCESAGNLVGATALRECGPNILTILETLSAKEEVQC